MPVDVGRGARTLASLASVSAASARTVDSPKSKSTPSCSVIVVPHDSTGLSDPTGGKEPMLPTAGTGSALMLFPLTSAVPSP